MSSGGAPGDVRAKSVCVVRRGDEILVGRGSDGTAREVFYRPLGGSIEFGERSDDAIRREFLEEIGAEVTRLGLVAVLENVFEYEGRPGHEIVFVYEGELADPSLYERDDFEWLGDDGEGGAWIGWRALSDFGPGGERLYPTGLLAAIRGSEGTRDSAA